MKIKTAVALALFGSALGISVPAIAAEQAAQPKPAAQPAAPAAKPAAAADKEKNAATVIPAECAKLADAKAKDECVKKVQAATGAASGTAGSSAAGAPAKSAQ